jgi:hypothetical protein
MKRIEALMSSERAAVVATDFSDANRKRIKELEQNETYLKYTNAT